MSNVYRIGAATYEFFGKFERPRGRTGKAKGSRIGEHGGVESGFDFG